MTNREIIEQGGWGDCQGVNEYKHEMGLYNKLTEHNITTREIVYSHFNHEEVWAGFHPEYYCFTNLLKRIKTDIRKYFEAKFYYRGQAQDLSEIYGQSGPAIVCGSGPSLEKVLPHLHKWKGAIFCNSSSASTIKYYGADPTYIDIVDPRVEDWELRAPFNYKKTSLVIQPCLHPRVLDEWKGKIYYYRIYEPCYEWYAKTLPIVYAPWIRTRSLPFGSMLSTSLSHAHNMGFAPIFLIGADLGYPGLASRFSKYTRERRISIKYKVRAAPELIKRWGEIDRKQKVTALTPAENQEGMMLNEIMNKERGIAFGWKWKRTDGGKVTLETQKENSRDTIVISENGIAMHHIQGIYRKQLMRVVALDAPQVINASEGSILDDMMLKVSPMYPIERQDSGFKHLIIPKKEIRRKAELFLARRRMYLLPASTGNACIGMDDWKKELQGAVEMINQGSPEYKIDYNVARKHLEDITDGITYVTD